jgi:ring-1,2-phenylacetyl-CoA epoxidase subunit PaaD
VTARAVPPLPLRVVRERVGAVADPELPMLTLDDLGVVRSVTAPHGGLEVLITPTLLGCPALPAIESEILAVLDGCGHPGGRVRQVLSPAWSSDWISAEGRRKLVEHGIAPPGPAGAPLALRLGTGVACPGCGSAATRPQSTFGATRCQTVLVCTACHETFAQLKAV